MASAKQIAANRNNAQKSTGPKTSAGKDVAKLNAVKHGLHARNVVLRGQHDNERMREFQKLHQRYWDHYAPAGPVEEMLVERIVTTYWRLHRVLISERGEIALNVDQGRWDRQRPAHFAFRMRLAALSTVEDVMQKMEESATGLMFLKDVLRRVRAAVVSDGELTDAALQATYFAGKPSSLTNDLLKLRQPPVADAAGLDVPTLVAQRRERLLQEIDSRLVRYRWMEKDCDQRENAEEAARQAAAHLPAASTMDKILRCETLLERQMYRAMDQLERLQRRRQGEDVPPPVNMEVSHRL